MWAIQIEERFCWDHGYHLGVRCPRCRHEIEKRLSRHKKNRAGVARGQESPQRSK